MVIFISVLMIMWKLLGKKVNWIGLKEIKDLCEISPYVKNSNSCYIWINDLYNLLWSKGLGKDSISVVFEEYDLGPRYPKINLNEGVYLNYDAVMKIGNPSYTRIKKRRWWELKSSFFVQSSVAFFNIQFYSTKYHEFLVP